MMKSHGRSRLRSVGGMAALAAAMLATGGLGTTAGAQEREGNRSARERFVIMEMREGEAPPSGLSRSFRVRRGANGEILAPEGCDDGAEGDGSKQPRRSSPPVIIMCGQGGEMSAEQRLQALERAREGIAEATDQRGARHRGEVLEVIDREIARMRRR